MLEMKAVFTKKTSEYSVCNCCIEKVTELGSKEFDDYVNNPLANMDFIEESKDLMFKDQKGQCHCILVLGEDRSDGVLIESEGYDYARYSSYVPHARAYIERELEQLCDFFLKEISVDEETGTQSIYFEDIAEFTGAYITDDCYIARKVYNTLEKHLSVSNIEASGDCICIKPAITEHGRNITDDKNATLQRRSDILRKTLDTLSEHFRGQEFYDILHDRCGLTNEEITVEGFDLGEYFTFEQSDTGPEMSM